MRRWMGWVGVVAVGVALTAVVAGCGGSSSSSSATTEAGGASNAKGSGDSLAYISPVASTEGQHQLIEAIGRAAKEAGWSVDVLDSQSSPDKQVSNVELAINKGYDAIASWSLDPNAVAGAYTAAQEKASR